MGDELTIATTPSERHRQTLELLFAALPTSERVAQMATTMAAVRSGRLSLEGLLEAQRGDATVGVVWASVMGGRAALVWPAQLAAGEREETVASLYAQLASWMHERDVQVANAFLADDHSADARRLTAAGFTRVAEILYLVSEQATFPDAQVATPLQFEVFSEAEQDRLAEIIERTYEGTLDCPALDGQRDIADVIQGYQETGVYNPSRWFFVRHDDADIGCLLLADHPAENQWELIYQGIIKTNRKLSITQSSLKCAKRVLD